MLFGVEEERSKSGIVEKIATRLSMTGRVSSAERPTF